MGYIAFIVFVTASGNVSLLEPVHFETRTYCVRYAKMKAREQKDVLVRHWSCMPFSAIRYNGDLLFEADDIFDGS
jgi:hypothetical protein